MKIVNTGNIYRIYDDDLRTYDVLPNKCYTVEFSPLSGFFLQLYPMIDVNEKIYGPHLSKVNKVLNAYKLMNRNLGVILSGDKGIGKSICAKLIAKKSLEENLPVIVVNKYIPGIADYLTEIEQECVVLFDEFDKTFAQAQSGRGNLKFTDEDRDGSSSSSQTTLLTLFDGLANSKKLFVVTCNDLNGLNDFLINRPGRFHYHFRFDYPTADEIREYMEDKLEPKYYGEISKVINFANKVDINYDCLRAISFELSQGIPFEEAIKDLNIVNIEPVYYNVYAILNDGTQTTTSKLRLDIFSEQDACYDYDGYYIRFNTQDIQFDTKLMLNIINSNDLHIDYDELVSSELRKESIYQPDRCDFENEDEYKNAVTTYKDNYNRCKNNILISKGIKYLVFKRSYGKNIHYLI